METRSKLQQFLLAEIKKHLIIPEGFSDELVHLNLLYLFSRDENTAVDWAAFIEREFDISIPDNEVDYYFFSSTACMADTIIRNTSIPALHERIEYLARLSKDKGGSSG